MSSKTAHFDDRLTLHIGTIAKFHRHSQSVANQSAPETAKNTLTL
jgi:hypothetical protein